MARTLVSDAQMRRLIRDDESSMTLRADILNIVRHPTDSGGATREEQYIRGVPCYRMPQMAGNTETLFGGQLVSGLQWKFNFPLGTPIDGGSTIIMGEEVFSVMGVLGPHSYETSLSVIAVEKSAVTGG